MIVQRYTITPRPSTSPAIVDRMTAFWRAGMDRDVALDRVEAAASARWKEEALEAIFVTCCGRQTFISDDIWEAGSLPSTREDRALGPVMLRAARLGWCQKTQTARPSVRSHLSGKPIWESLLHLDPTTTNGEHAATLERRRIAEGILGARRMLSRPRQTDWWPS